MSVNYARLCFQYSGAVALMRGMVGLQDFAEDRLRDRDRIALGQRISVIEDGSTDPAAFTPQIATAQLKNGKTIEARIDTLYGSPKDPMSIEAHLEKFRSCLTFGFGAEQPRVAQQLIKYTDTLEGLGDVSILSRLAAGLET